MTPQTTQPVTEAKPRNIVTDTLVWRGVTIQVSYEPDWLGLSAAGLELGTAHLELHVLSPKGAPLPVTDTGYRSEFLDFGLVEDAGGPAAFAAAWLEARSNTQSWRVARARWEQQDLFQ